jgi:hypothetical protein
MVRIVTEGTDHHVALRAMARNNALARDRLLGACVPTDRGGHDMVPERIVALIAQRPAPDPPPRQAHAMLAGTGLEPPQLDEFFPDCDRHPFTAAFLP